MKLWSSLTSFGKLVVIKFTIVLAVLIGFSAFAQTDGTVVRYRDLVGSGSTLLPTVLRTTSAAVSLFVDPTGNDSNACTSTGTAACLTIQGATNKIPKWLRHTALITIASGTYALGGAYVDGFDAVNDLNAPSTGTYIQYDGTLITATVATGTATGTATGGTAGNTTGTFGTLVDGAQTWTVNDLRGKIIEITGGTGSGQRQVIQSNTATTITIVGDWTAPTGTSTYAVRDWGTIITGSLALPAQNSFTASTASSGAFIIGSTVRSDTAVTLRWLKFTGAAVSISNRGSALMRLNENRFESTASQPIVSYGGTFVTARNSFSLGGSATSAIGGLNQYYPPVSSTEDFFRGSAGTGSAFGITFDGRLTFSNSAFENLANGIRTNQGFLSISGVQFNSITGDCIGSNSNGFTTSLGGSASILVTSAAMSTCGVAFNISGGNQLTSASVAGATNTVIYRVLNGGYIQEASTSTITGTTEIDVDGTSYTIAALRAAGPPKSITDLATFSRIWEP